MNIQHFQVFALSSFLDLALDSVLSLTRKILPKDNKLYAVGCIDERQLCVFILLLSSLDSRRKAMLAAARARDARTGMRVGVLASRTVLPA